MRLGIDFGTCFSSAAFMEGGTLTLIKDPSSLGFSVPSSIFVTSQGQVLVGKAANNQRLRDPQRYRRELKRDLGRQDRLLLGDQALHPRELVAHILCKIKRDADSFMTNTGRPVLTGAVLTIPATYQEHKRTLMLQAAVEAGFVAEETTLLEEPVAAALYYARQNTVREGEILLIYDLGGGTFDTALLQKKGNGFEYLAVPAGIERCGGVDFDRAIYANLVRQEAELQDLLQASRDDKAALVARLSIGEMCIDLKHQLSDVEDAELAVVVPGTGTFLEYPLKRATFEQMIAPAVEETITCCRQMIQRASVSYKQINRVLLVGGSCRIPYVQQRLQQEFKRPISMAPDLELVVCQGAALHAAQHPVSIVSPNANEGGYTTIGAAIEAAQPKSQIIVRPGTYRENIVIEREIEIIGAGPPDAIIIESAEATCIQMATPTARVRGLTIRHTLSTAPTLHQHGAVVIAQGHLTLQDCVIDSQVCGVSIWGAEGNATLRRCQIHACRNAAVAFSRGGQGTIESCDLSGNAATLVDIRDKGSVATVWHSTIHDGQSLGISISSEGQATLEESEIFGNTAAGIQVYGTGSSATMRQCRVYAGKDKGIAVWQKGQVTIENCAIFGNLYAGVLIGDEGSVATIKHSQIYEGKYVGIAIVNKGRAIVEECDLYGNVGAAIRANDEGSQVSIQDCHIHEGMYAGIVIERKSQGELINNQIFRNRGPGIRICNPGSKAEIAGGEIRGNAVGLVIEDEAEGTIRDCTIEKNRIDTYTEPRSNGSNLQFLFLEEKAVQKSFQQWLQEGKNLLDHNHYKEALIAFEQATQLNPSEATAWYNKGYTFIILGNFKEAADAYIAATKLNPDLLLAHIFKDRLPHFLELNSYDEVLATITQVLIYILDPQLLQFIPQFVLMQTFKVGFLAHTSSDLGLKKSSFEEEIVKVLDQTIESASDSILAYVVSGLVLNELNREEEADVVIEQLIELAISSPLAGIAKAVGLTMLEHQAEADVLGDQVAELAPTSPLDYVIKAGALNALKREKEANAVLDQLVKFAVSSPLDGFFRIMALNALKREKEANAVLDQLVKHALTFPLNCLVKAIALKMLKREEEAIAILDHIVEFAPNVLLAHIAKAVGLMVLEHKEEAIASFDQAIESPLAYLAKSASMLDSEEEALIVIDQAIHLDHGLTIAHFWKAFILYNLDRKEEALTAIEQAIDLVPRSALTHCCKAFILYNLDRKEETLGTIEQVIHLVPRSTLAHFCKAFITTW